jgi:hypothetical protein
VTVDCLACQNSALVRQAHPHPADANSIWVLTQTDQRIVAALIKAVQREYISVPFKHVCTRSDRLQRRVLFSLLVPVCMFIA